MSANAFVNVLFLVTVNAIFMIAGLFLNITVIITFWRSSPLRKQLCYFMILVLSCFDLAVIAISHPLQINSIILFYQDKNTEIQERIRININLLLNGLSGQALFLLTTERYLALLYPFFHQHSVTRKNLVVVLAIMFILLSGTMGLRFLEEKISKMLTLIQLSIFLLLFAYYNYKMLLVAKSKRMNQAVPSSTHDGKRSRIWSRKFTTCSFTVICYFICSCPSLAFAILRLTSLKAHFLNRQVILFNLWANTSFLMNSTLNCLIFFWRNSILRLQAMTMLKCSRLTSSSNDSLK